MRQRRLTDRRLPSRSIFPARTARAAYEVYTSPEIYRLEQERIFRGPVWSFVAMEAEIAASTAGRHGNGRYVWIARRTYRPRSLRCRSVELRLHRRTTGTQFKVSHARARPATKYPQRVRLIYILTARSPARSSSGRGRAVQERQSSVCQLRRGADFVVREIRQDRHVSNHVKFPH